MKSKLTKYAMLAAIFLTGMYAGFSISRINQFQGVSEALVAFGDMHHLDKYLSVSQQISIYKAYEESTNKGREFQKHILAILYDESTATRLMIENMESIESDLFLTNKLIAEFLTEDPLAPCGDVPTEERLECNLRNKLLFDRAE
mgnify:CR=1 FL=1